MRFDLLTDAQLRALAGNKAHLTFISRGAANELRRRGPQSGQQPDLSAMYRQELAQRDPSLPVGIRLLLLVVPAIHAFLFGSVLIMGIVLTITGAAAALMLDHGETRKWKQLWKWIMLWYAAGTVAILGYGMLNGG